MYFIPVLTLFLVYINYQRANRRHFGIVTLLLLAYLAMGSFSIVRELSGKFPSSLEYSLGPMLYMSFAFLVIFTGFTGFRDNCVRTIRIDNVPVFRGLQSFLIVGGMIAIAFFLPFAIKSLSGDIGSNRNLQVAQGVAFAKWGIVNSICSLLANCFIFAIICAFLNLLPGNTLRSKRRARLLMISSLSYVVYVLAYVGRDGVVYWSMSFLFCYFLFKKFLAEKMRIMMKRFFFVMLPLFVIPFMMITISRFSGSPIGVFWEIVNYGGQQVRHFNDHYIINAPIYHGRFEFPILWDFKSLLGASKASSFDVRDTMEYYERYRTVPWVFSTFIGTLMMDIGKISALSFLLLLSLLIRKTYRRINGTGIFRFSQLLIFTLFYQFVFWGVFYNRMYAANYYMLFIIFVFLASKYLNPTPYRVIDFHVA